MFQLQYSLSLSIYIILPNVNIDVYNIFWGKSKHTHVHVQTHTISYMHVRLPGCIPINMETYILKNSCYIALFCTHVSFQAKEVDAPIPKGEEQVFFIIHDRAGTTLVEHKARFILGSTAVLRNSKEIKTSLNAELPTYWKQIFQIY